jgi:hypothetical protein
MHRFKLVGLALLAVFALASVAAASASAETPLILVLPGEKVSELKYTGEGGKGVLEDAGLRTIEGTKVKATATFAAVAGKEADAETGEAALTFEGTKKGAVACRSETKAGVKDPVETILVNTALTAASEETTAKALQGVLVNTLKEVLFINCGGVKEEVTGSLPCLVTPVLSEVAAGGNVEILCSEKEGVQQTGKCVETKATCEKLAGNPFLANLGTKLESAGESVTVKGSFNKMVTLDD